MAVVEPQRETPYTVRALASVTGFKMCARTGLRRKGHKPPFLVVRIRRCAVRLTAVTHLVGGITRRFDTESPEEGVTRLIIQDRAVFGSEAACHAAVRRMLTQLPQLARSYGHRAADVQFWDQFVPPTLVASILAGAARLDRVAAGGGDLRASRAARRSYTCVFSMRVHVTTEYSVAMELVLSCEDAAAGARAGADILGGGDAAQCAVCMEELQPEADGLMGLPGCSHVFHRGCILQWFHRAATCPSCRHDTMQYLPEMFRVWHTLE